MTLPSTTTIQRSGGGATQLAAVPLSLRSTKDRKYLAESLAQSRAIADRAWKHYTKLGVVRYPLNRASKIAGSATLYAATVADGEVVGRIERGDQNAAAIDIVKGIYSRFGGVRGLIERYFLLQKIPADSYLIRVKARGGYDGYAFISPDELHREGDSATDPLTAQSPGTYEWHMAPTPLAGAAPNGRDDDKPMVHPIARDDFLGRAWQPSPRYINLPDSPLHTLDYECDLLHRMLILLRAQYHSRAVFSGMLFFPNTLSHLAAGKITANSATEFLAAVNKVITTNAELMETGDAADVAKILISGQPEAGGQITDINPGRDTQETDLRLREEVTQMILFALDINTRAASGDSETRYQNWNDQADELRLAVLPDVQGMCWTLTRLILHRELKKLGWEDERIASTAVWFDLSEASVRINRQEDSRQLADRGMLSDAVTLRTHGWNEGDMPSEVEAIRRYGWINKNPYLATFEMGAAERIDWELAMPKATGRPQDTPGDEEPSEGPGTDDDGSPGVTEDDSTKS